MEGDKINYFWGAQHFFCFVTNFSNFVTPYYIERQKGDITMKVEFKYGLAGYTGKADDLVYYFDPSTGKVYARRKTYPRLTKENERIGKISQNIFGLKPSEAYKDDLKLYLLKYKGIAPKSSPCFRSWVNVYIYLMTNMAKLYPDIDLKTITREQIDQNNLPCKSVRDAVVSGILPPVRGYERLDALL
ncbi:MAG: hypothetical protein ABFC98_06540 [Candidatus Cloacimonas sp.]